VAGRIVGKYRAIAEDRLAVLAEDFRTVENIESQLQIYKQDMEREFKGRIAQIENIVFEMKERGDSFFEDTLRVARLRDLFNSEQIQREFQEKVIADTERRVDDATNSLIDWMVDQDLRLWQGVTDYINRRRQAGVTATAEYDEHVIGGIGAQFAYNRDVLLKSVVQEARQVVESYDRREEAAQIAQDMRSAVSLMVAAGGGAALGALVAATASLAFLDITGITAALVSGAIGLFILPYRKRKAQEEFRQRTLELRDKLGKAMIAQFNEELNNSIARIREAITPYTRFVRAEHERVSGADAQLAEIDDKLEGLRGRVEAIGR
jgi:hypothetical protein